MKMSARSLFACLLFIAVSPFSVQAFAQASGLSACRAIEDRLERFDCYERLEDSGAPAEVAPASSVSTPAPADVNRPLTAQEQANRENLPVYSGLFSEPVAEEAAAASVAAPVVATAPAGNDVDSFGRKDSATNAQSAQNAQIVENEDGKTELVDTVAALDDRGRQRWLVTLESGQKWRQMVGKRYGLEVGDEVRIYPSGWGSSYRLAVERLGGFIQVERVD